MTASSKLIRVINPNSNTEVTQQMSLALDGLRLPGGPRIDCITFADAPFGIENVDHINQVIPMLEQHVQTDQAADAFIIACYSDPGLDNCRALTTRPVFGIQNSGVLAAMALGRRFGVIALSQAAIGRHLIYLEQMGVLSSLAAERPLGMSVAECEAPEAYSHIADLARALRDEDGAECLVLGCAGMARHRAQLAEETGLPVVDPTWAAVNAAMGAVL